MTAGDLKVTAGQEPPWEPVIVKGRDRCYWPKLGGRREVEITTCHTSQTQLPGTSPGLWLQLLGSSRWWTWLLPDLASPARSDSSTGLSTHPLPSLSTFSRAHVRPGTPSFGGKFQLKQSLSQAVHYVWWLQSQTEGQIFLMPRPWWSHL